MWIARALALATLLWCVEGPLRGTCSAQEHDSEEAAEGKAFDKGVDAPTLPLAAGGPWYGWQTLTVDAIGIALGGLSLTADKGGLQTALAAIGVTIAVPIIHSTHGNGTAASASLALRLFASVPIVIGGFIHAFGSRGYCEPDDPTVCTPADYKRAGDWLKPGLVVLLLVSAIDAGAFAYDRQPRAPQLSVSPWLSPRAGGFGLDVRGAL